MKHVTETIRGLKVAAEKINTFKRRYVWSRQETVTLLTLI